MRIGTVHDLRTIHGRIRAAIDRPAQLRLAGSLLEITDTAQAVWVFRVAGRLRPCLAALQEPDCTRLRVLGLGCGSGGLPVGEITGGKLTAIVVGLGGMP